MTPLICDFTGDVIVAAADPQNGPQLGRDYFVAYNRVLSVKGKEKLDAIVWESMKARGFGKYNFMEYKRVFKAAVDQYCNRSKTTYNKPFHADNKNDFHSAQQSYWQ
ncbi:MAG: hypothetical protein HKM05_06860 [Spirochaetales bacterium]|nr:hypothetical protein [Spirochaetales bacterium]